MSSSESEALGADVPLVGDRERTPRPRRGPLSDLRVADFCWAGVGAVATRLLADFGAQVIKIEDRNHVDITRRLPLYKGGEARNFGEEGTSPEPDRGGVFNNYCRNKLGVTINMRTERGRQLAEQLISVSSVVTENFAPGVMERWGLTCERVKELSPEVIYARMSGFGHTGPDAKYRSYGPVVQAVSGLSYMAGLPGREPSGWGLSHMDNMAAYYNSAALLMAVWNRRRTGYGTEIDVSAVEVGVGLLGPILLDISVNGRSSRRSDFPHGNRLEYLNTAPHGVYRCAGDDRWLALAVFDEAEWQRLLVALGHPDWSRDQRFVSQNARFTHQDELDGHLAKWFSDRDPHEAMHVLQAHGVRAAAVQNLQDLSERDEQLKHRPTFFDMDHPVIGRARFEAFPGRLSRTPVDHWRSAPLLGEDNEYVFGGMLGVEQDELEQLREQGVI